jgi:hypothetical protein
MLLLLALPPLLTALVVAALRTAASAVRGMCMVRTPCRWPPRRRRTRPMDLQVTMLQLV